MSETWHRQENEPNRWHARFERYRLMGSQRTLLGCVHAEEADRGREKRSKKVPGAWDKAFQSYSWKARAEAFDEAERARIEAERQAYVDSILQEGYALKHERVKALANMAHLIEASYTDETTGKPIFPWLTPEKIKEWRGCLDDIAKELGARIQKKELTGKDGGPIQTVEIYKVRLPDNGRDNTE